jgi:hypothetical protein
MKEIEQERGSDRLLILNQPNSAAKGSAQSTNHITLPHEGIRVVLPGIVLRSPEREKLPSAPAVPSLKGASGRIVETLLLHSRECKTLRDLAAKAEVSLGLTHRVIHYLEGENLIRTPNSTPTLGAEPDGSNLEELLYREIVDPIQLLKLWAEASSMEGTVFARGYLYSPDPMVGVRAIQSVIPGSCLGSTLAANTYVRRLSQVPQPFKIWIPEAYSRTENLSPIPGLELVDSGANFVFAFVRGDHWARNAEVNEGIRRISRPRCFVELYDSSGRIQELAEAILESIK